MLLRLGRVSCFFVFALLVLVWTSVHDKSRVAIYKGWKVTTQAFGQGSSFASDSVSIDVQPAVAKADLSPYAYVFYATQDTYACSVLVNIRQLKETHKTKHRIFVLLTEHVSMSYIEEFERFGVTVSIQTPPALAEGSQGAGYYADCLLKLYGFRMHHIDNSLKRVIVLDSDQLVLKNLDYLFDDRIEVDLAAPRAYWIARETFSTAFMLITLSDRLWNTIESALQNIKVDKYDMDVVNEMLGDTVLMLPGHFVTLNSHWEDWNLPKWFHESALTDAIDATHLNKTLGLPASGDLVKRGETQALDAHEKADADVDAEIRSHSPASEEAPVQIGSFQDKPAVSVAAKLPSMEEVKAAMDLPPTHMTDDELSAFDESAPAIPDMLDTSKHENGKPHFANGIIPSGHAQHLKNGGVMDTPQPPIVQLEGRKFYNELFELYRATSVLHFTALGKPWSVNNATITRDRPEAHPVFKEQFLMWRQLAMDWCPTDVVVEP